MPLLPLLSPSSDFHATSVEVSSPDTDNAPKSPEGDSGLCATSELSVTKIESDDKATHFYTGLPSWGCISSSLLIPFIIYVHNWSPPLHKQAK